MPFSNKDPVVYNKLLFYVQNKIHSTPKDVILESWARFYSVAELTEAISVLENALKTHMTKRH